MAGTAGLFRELFLSDVPLAVPGVSSCIPFAVTFKVNAAKQPGHVKRSPDFRPVRRTERPQNGQGRGGASGNGIVILSQPEMV